MISLTFAAVLQVSLVGALDAETYAQAHQEAQKTGHPVLVLVGTEWCGPCKEMKNSVLPEAQRQGVFEDVHFALVNADAQSSLAKQLTGGGPVPQLVMYNKVDDGWKRRKLIGLQSVDSIRSFVRSGVTAHEIANAPIHSANANKKQVASH